MVYHNHINFLSSFMVYHNHINFLSFFMVHHNHINFLSSFMVYHNHINFLYLSMPGETERVLVVSPLKTMLDDVRKEMSKLGVPLAVLRGGAVEQQSTLKAWQTGGFKGLLSDPEIPALNLSEASTVVFLSPVLTDTQFLQAAGRVVRQGSLHQRVRVVVLGAAQSAETEDAARIERFRKIAHDMSMGQIYEPVWGRERV